MRLLRFAHRCKGPYRINHRHHVATKPETEILYSGKLEHLKIHLACNHGRWAAGYSMQLNFCGSSSLPAFNGYRNLFGSKNEAREYALGQLLSSVEEAEKRHPGKYLYLVRKLKNERSGQLFLQFQDM